MHCYVCSGTLESLPGLQSTLEATRTPPARHGPINCYQCSAPIANQHTCLSHGVVVHPRISNLDKLLISHLCHACFASQYTMQPLRTIPCHVCGEEGCHRLTISVGGGARIVLRAACTPQHYEQLLGEMQRLRVGWCSKCNLQHCRGTILSIRRYHELTTTGWFSMDAWRVWWERWKDPDIKVVRLESRIQRPLPALLAPTTCIVHNSTAVKAV